MHDLLRFPCRQGKDPDDRATPGSRSRDDLRSAVPVDVAERDPDAARESLIVRVESARFHELVAGPRVDQHLGFGITVGTEDDIAPPISVHVSAGDVPAARRCRCPLEIGEKGGLAVSQRPDLDGERVGSVRRAWSGHDLRPTVSVDIAARRPNSPREGAGIGQEGEPGFRLVIPEYLYAGLLARPRAGDYIRDADIPNVAHRHEDAARELG